MEDNDWRKKVPGDNRFSVPEGASADFVQLWNRHKGELYELCLRWMQGRHADAEEAFSNASVVAMLRLRECGEQVRNPRAWLGRIYRNACMDLYRKHKRLRELALPELGEVQASDALAAVTVSRNPQQRYLEREMGRYLGQAIRSLPPRLRIPLVLRSFQQMSYQEIAVDLRITEENVRKRVQQARQALAQSLVSYHSGRVPRQEAAPASSERDWLSEAEQARAPEEPELALAGGILQAVQVRLPAGALRPVLLVLERPEELRAAARLPALARYVEAHPGGWKKRLAMADALRALGRWDEAIEQYRRVAHKRPMLLRVWLRLGQMLHLLSRDEEAADAFESALRAARQDATRHHLQGWIERCRGDAGAAVEELGQAVVREPAEAAHRLALAQLHLEADRTAEALGALDEMLRISPDSLPGLVAGHDALLLAGRVREAERRARRLLDADPGSFIAAERLGTLRLRRRLVQGREGAETRRLLEHAARQAPAWPAAAASLALFHVLRGQQARAEIDLEAVTGTYPESARAWMLSARVLRRAGRPGPAGDAILRALSLDPEELDVCLAACEILLRAGRRDEARRVRARLLERFSGSWRAWKAEAAARLAEGAPDSAVAASSRVVELQPGLAAAWLSHGTTLYRAGRLRAAADALEEGWRRLPAGDGRTVAARLAAGLGQAFRDLGEADKAALWAQRSGPDESFD